MAQRHLDRWRAAGRTARSAYAAFLPQGRVLVGLALALRPVAIAAEVKPGLVAVRGVGLCLGIGRVPVTRTALGHFL